MRTALALLLFAGTAHVADEIVSAWSPGGMQTRGEIPIARQP